MLPLSIPRVLSSSKLPFRKRYHPRLAVMFSIRVEMCAPAPKFYPNEIILLGPSKSKNLAFTGQTLAKKNCFMPRYRGCFVDLDRSAWQKVFSNAPKFIRSFSPVSIHTGLLELLSNSISWNSVV